MLRDFYRPKKKCLERVNAKQCCRNGVKNKAPTRHTPQPQEVVRAGGIVAPDRDVHVRIAGESRQLDLSENAASRHTPAIADKKMEVVNMVERVGLRGMLVTFNHRIACEATAPSRKGERWISSSVFVVHRHVRHMPF